MDYHFIGVCVDLCQFGISMHFKRDCPKLATDRSCPQKGGKHRSHNVTEGDSSEEALVACHSVSVGASAGWIVDSEATCHMCNYRQLFGDYRKLEKLRSLRRLHWGTGDVWRLLAVERWCC